MVTEVVPKFSCSLNNFIINSHLLNCGSFSASIQGKKNGIFLLKPVLSILLRASHCKEKLLLWLLHNRQLHQPPRNLSAPSYGADLKARHSRLTAGDRSHLQRGFLPEFN